MATLESVIVEDVGKETEKAIDREKVCMVRLMIIDDTSVRLL